ncbi:Uncharacterized protein APZ42_033747 [Daphnia magna]|uniref:Uncharacterized protein n=1 Tax=Daphnia magna TaxID=35525 RepID=A0A164KUT0_9CRUS|nr:Uncharacterized protein APZ42_033747 [Daphnia magna]
MNETVTGTDSPDFYGQPRSPATTPPHTASASSGNNSQRTRSGGINDDVDEATGSGRHHYRTTSTSRQRLSLPEDSNPVTVFGAPLRNRPASLSPFRPGSATTKHRADDGNERYDRSDAAGWRPPNAHQDNNCSRSSGSTIWRHPSLTVDQSHHHHNSTAQPLTSTSSSSSSSGLFSWRKKHPRRSSSSSVVPTSSATSFFTSCVAAPPTDPVRTVVTPRQQKHERAAETRPSTPSRRSSQPAAFSLPQLVRRSLQPLISSSPSTDVDDQSDSVGTKLRYMKCKQVAICPPLKIIETRYAVGRYCNSAPGAAQFAPTFVTELNESGLLYLIYCSVLGVSV